MFLHIFNRGEIVLLHRRVGVHARGPISVKLFRHCSERDALDGAIHEA